MIKSIKEDKGIENWRFLIGNVNLSLLRLRIGSHTQFYFFLPTERKREEQKDMSYSTADFLLWVMGLQLKNSSQPDIYPRKPFVSYSLC